MLKRLMVVLGTAFAMMSTASVAENQVQMTDAQLDEITAGRATSIVILSNGGNAEILRENRSGTHATCINCGLGLPPGGKAAGALIVVNRGHPNGFTRSIGGGRLF